MKTFIFRLACSIIAVIPLSAAAQTHIKSAYSDFLKNPKVKVTEYHNLNKDPHTNVKTGQCDTYEFTLPAKDISLLKDIQSAFFKDVDSSYKMENGKNEKSGNDLRIWGGDPDNKGILINEKGYDYIYALFLAPKAEDPDGKYRYAYGMKYKEEGNMIVGKIFMSYAPTMAKRQKEKSQFKSTVFYNGKPIVTESQWMSAIMVCVQNIMASDISLPTRIHLATNIFDIIHNRHNYHSVSEEEITTVRGILEVLLADKNNADGVVHTLLIQSLKNLN